ncbi:autotransporter outer membrane beta-barrel domain-containing protein [Salmonella enterica]|nr:autotransporter domain-containing protein [Salmonella enterica]
MVPDIDVGPMVDVDNTLHAMEKTANSLARVINMRQSSLMNLLDEDCTVINGNFCLGVGSRFSDSNELNMTSGSITLAYRPNEKLRMGLTIDQSLTSSLPSDYKLRSYKPGLGIFSAFKPTNDIDMRMGIAFKEDKLEISRQQLSNTEAGKGKTNLKGHAASLTVSYNGFNNKTFNLIPYGGVFYSRISRDGYMEYDKISFNANYKNIDYKTTSINGGIKTNIKISEEVDIAFDTRIERDVKNSYSNFVSEIPGIGSLNFENPKIRKIRVSSDVKLSLKPSNDSEYFAGFYWKQNSLPGDNGTGVKVGYRVSF